MELIPSLVLFVIALVWKSFDQAEMERRYTPVQTDETKPSPWAEKKQPRQ